MTTLAITPNWKNKTAKFRGTVAAGEHVAVTIQNDNGEGAPFIGDASTLRLRVVDPASGRTLAIFPEPVPEGETPETWDGDLSPLRCTLNLNTVQMLKAVPPAANVPLLFVLDDYENKTLYFKEQFPVEHWPRLRGEEEPTDLDNYKDIIADFSTRLDGYGTRITGAENAAQAATENASAAAEQAASAAATANNAIAIAQDAKSGASDSALAAHNSALAAEEAQEAAESAAESINSPDATLTGEGVAADAKATGERIAAEETRAKAAEAAEESRAKAAESALTANVSSAQKAISDEAELRAAADADLEANKADKTAVAAISADVAAAQAAIVTKADKATTYTKSEVDAKVAGVQTFQKLVVNELPSAEAADDKTIYLVPRAGSETPDLCDEYVTVGAAGSRRWEKIGGGTVDLANYYTKSETNAALAGKAPATNIAKSALAQDVQTSLGKADSALQTAPVTSVNGKTGAVALAAGDVGAVPLSDEVVYTERGIRAYYNTRSAASDLGILVGTGSAIHTFTTLYSNASISGWKFSEGTRATLLLPFPWASKTENMLALLSDIYAAVQQIAPDFTAKTYVLNELCTHNGVVYRCNSAYTATASSTKPNADTTHWEAKKVSELFLGRSGGQIISQGSLTIWNILEFIANYGGDGITFLSGGSKYTLKFPFASGTLALLTDTMRFSAEGSYDVDDVVFHDGSFYRCTTAHTAGAWNASHFAEVLGGLSTGAPTAPTPNEQSADTQIANKKYVDDAVAGGGGGNLDYVMRVDPETGGIYYTTPDTNA